MGVQGLWPRGSGSGGNSAAAWASRAFVFVAAVAAAVSSASTTAAEASAVAAWAAEALWDCDPAVAAGATWASRAAVARVLAVVFGGEKVDTAGAGLTAGAGGQQRCHKL